MRTMLIMIGFTLFAGGFIAVVVVAATPRIYDANLIEWRLTRN